MKTTSIRERVGDPALALNTALEHGKRGRRVEYSIGWPVDQRTMAGIEQLRQSDWGAGVHTDGEVDPAAQVADLTGILRHGPSGDRLAGWPTDMRLITRRTPRPANKPAKLGEHPDFEYGAFVTNTGGGQVQFLDARHRTQAHVEDRMKQFKACGARNLPSIDCDRNSAWLQLAALATSLTAWLRHLALEGELAKASTKTLRFADPVRARPDGHPRQTTNPENPTRLEMVARPGRRLGPPPSPTSSLTPAVPPPRPDRTTSRAWNSAPTRAHRALPHAQTPNQDH